MLRMNVSNQVHRLVQFNLSSFLRLQFSKSISFKRSVVTVASGGKNIHQCDHIPPYSVCEPNFNKSYWNKIQSGNSYLVLNVQQNILDNVPSLPVTSRNQISDPKDTIVNVELPFNSLRIEDFQLPTLNNRELVDPVSIITEKKAVTMIKIRKRKMRKHKWKKLQKKMKFTFARLRRKKRLKKEVAFQKELSSITEEGVKYNAASDLEERIALVNWKPPVTRVRGLIAPQWVIENHLKEERLKSLLNERIENCLKKM